MGRRNKSKKRQARSVPRGSQGGKRRRSKESCELRWHDLNVPLPRNRKSTVLDQELLTRAKSVGYGVVAFSLEVYGRPDPKKDSLAKFSLEVGGLDQSGITVLRRLNVVVEHLSELASFTDSEVSSAASRGQTADLLNSYDLVAISPRSDDTFSSVCSTASRADIIMLDYTAGRGSIQLPFKLRTSDIRSAARIGLTFDLCYGPALLDPSKRRALVRAAVELQNCCRRVQKPQPRILLSSGARIASDSDQGSLAIRTPGDLINILWTLLHFDDKMAADALGSAPEGAVARGETRKTGRGGGTSVRIDSDASIARADEVPAFADTKTCMKRKGCLEGRSRQELSDVEPSTRLEKGRDGENTQESKLDWFGPSNSSVACSDDLYGEQGDSSDEGDGFLKL